MSLKDILGNTEYNALNKELKNRLLELKDKKQGAEVRKREAEQPIKERREVIMDFLHDVYNDELCQNYMKLKGEGFSIYKFGKSFQYTLAIMFYPMGIYLSYRQGRIMSFGGLIKYNLKFDQGYASTTIDCGMGGSRKTEFCIENLVKDVEKFKTEVSENIRRVLKNE